jgi:hypothetical protein
VPERPQILLADASVLIDYRDTNLSVLTLASAHLGPVRVVYEVLEEVGDFDVELATTLGIEVVDVPTQLLLEIDSLPHRLSRQDRLSYLACRENDWICLTNDRHLRGLCKEGGVRLCWGLEMMVDLVERGALSKEVALRTAQDIHTNNPGHISLDVLERFRAQTS